MWPTLSRGFRSVRPGAGRNVFRDAVIENTEYGALLKMPVDRWRESLLPSLAIASAIACSPAGVQTIHTTPRTACVGKPLTVEWGLRGTAILSASPQPPGWSDLQVEGSGETSTVIHSGTRFTLLAASASPPHHDKTAYVPVVTETSERMAPASCGVDGQLRATVSMGDLPEDVRVRQIRDPVAVWPGHSRSSEICLIHLGRAHCLKPGERAAFPELARGDWELSLPQSFGPDCAGAPSQLGLHIDVECPQGE